MVIPITMVGASVFLKSKFESFQVWGSVFILIGAVVASSDYFFKLGLGGNNVDDDVALNTIKEEEEIAASSANTLLVSAAVALYFISVVPSALSNIYKESKMKEQDMNEMHTSTIVSFWQLLFGFLFLPLMSLPALGMFLFLIRLYWMECFVICLTHVFLLCLCLCWLGQVAFPTMICRCKSRTAGHVLWALILTTLTETAATQRCFLRFT
jgi:hypothetical protein